MALIVQKFGGTSVGSVELIQAAAERTLATRNDGHRVVVVLSAMGDTTDRLAGLARRIAQRPGSREMDMLLTSGEQVSIALMCMALQERGVNARSYLGSQVPIVTDGVFGKARIRHVGCERLLADLDEGTVPVVAGFQGAAGNGEITSLGRGGSDTTAVALAAALDAEECQILSDVDGIYTTDPRVVPAARRMERVTFEEILEMSSLGSRVLQRRAVEFAGKYNVPLRVMSATGQGPGTLISYEAPELEGPVVSGIAFNRDEAEITIASVPDEPGVAYQILAPVADARIEVDMIVLNAPRDGRVDLSFTVHRSDFDETRQLVEAAVGRDSTTEVIGNAQVAKISVVGVGMRSHAGIAARMFEALAAEGINVRMIATSEIKVSVLVEERYLELGVRSLHEAFGLDQIAGGGAT
ncbi:MAG: aspartate kinase [Gammaproteobacteria bacterium]|nr:aspartate kinase [Gammaproteobacteria bacterium]